MTPTTHQYKKFSDFRRDTISYSVDGRTTTMPNMSEKDKVTFIKEVIWYVWNGATILPGERSTLHLAIERAIFEENPTEYTMASAKAIAKKRWRIVTKILNLKMVFILKMLILVCSILFLKSSLVRFSLIPYHVVRKTTDILYCPIYKLTLWPTLFEKKIQPLN